MGLRDIMRKRKQKKQPPKKVAVSKKAALTREQLLPAMERVPTQYIGLVREAGKTGDMQRVNKLVKDIEAGKLKVGQYIAVNGKFKRGQIPWNKGLKKEQIPWNKGLTKEDHYSILLASNRWKGENNPIHKKENKDTSVMST